MSAAPTSTQQGTKATAKFVRMSAYKAREVLDLIRGQDVDRAVDILRFTDRHAAEAVGKVLSSAMANAEHNDEQDPEALYVSACWADEGRTMRRYRPRARGRATRIRKRTCHITIYVSRLPDEELQRRREREAARPGTRAARRAGQEAADERRRRRRGRRQGPDAAESAAIAEAAEEEGIVDQQAEAVAAAEAADDMTVAEDATAPAEAAAEAGEEAGIVDQQAEADAAATEAEDISPTEQEEEEK
jgi:large subunit ribosomal protein L22